MEILYENDAYLNNIYNRFSKKWDCSKKDELAIYQLIKEYKKNNPNAKLSSIFYKILDLLLNINFQLLYYYRKIYVNIINNEIMRKFISNFKKKNPIDNDLDNYLEIKEKCKKYY